MGAIITAIIGGATKFLPFLTPLLDRFTDTAKIAEMRAEKELIEARAFARGRISPKYLMGYAVAFVFIIYGVVILLATFAPGFVGGAEDVFHHLKAMIGLSAEIGQ
jgi:hypothetical protein